MSNAVQMTFEYDVLDVETRQFVQQKADETHGLLKRTAEHIIRIGQNLQAVKAKLPHGQFLAWVQVEFGMSRWTAQNFMRVAENLGDKWGNFHHLPASILYELATPSTSEAILEQVQAGEIAPTLDEIKAAKEAERQARAAEQEAHSEKQQVEVRLFQVQEEAETRIAQLTEEIAHLQQQIATLMSQPIEVREVEKQVVSPEVATQIAALEQQVERITQQRDTLTRQVAQLGEEVRTAALKQSEGDQERRIRLNWYRVTNEFRTSVGKILSQWPSPLDVQAFEADDWTRLSQTRELAQRLLDECLALTTMMVVEATSATEASPEQEQSIRFTTHKKTVASSEEQIPASRSINDQRDQDESQVKRDEKIARAYQELKAENKTISCQALATRAHVRWSFCNQWLAKHHPSAGTNVST